MTCWMKQTLTCLSALLILIPVKAADLSAARDAYQKASDTIRTEYQPKFEGLQQQYRQSLEMLRAKVQDEGDLDKTKAALAEIARFEKAKSLPAAQSGGEIPEIKTLQAAYVKQFTAWEQEMAAKQGALTAKYVQALDMLQKNLVRAGKLGEATAVQEEKGKLSETAKSLSIPPVPLEIQSETSETAVSAERDRTSDADYLMIDLSEGKSATRYPVRYLQKLADVPGGANSDTYKTTRLLLRRIPQGTFVMGSPANEMGRGRNETRHSVMLSHAFFIGVFEVTQRQWERVTGEWPSYFNRAECRETRPVEQVTYEDIRGAKDGAGWPASDKVDAASFMGLLRAKAGLPFDLPTEAQWEYACRAGTDTALNSGKNLTRANDACPNVGEVARYRFNGGSECAQSVGVNGATAKVGSYLPNAWGLYDMHGNDWEWCLDWAGNYPMGAVTDPAGAANGKYRVLRGGSLDNVPTFCRSACRNQIDPSYRYITGGLRVTVQGGGRPATAGSAKMGQPSNAADVQAASPAPETVKVKAKWTKALQDARSEFLANNDLDSAELVSRMRASLEQPNGLSQEALDSLGNTMKKRTRELVRRGALESASAMNMAQWYALVNDNETSDGEDGPARTDRRKGGDPGPNGLVLYLPFDAPSGDGTIRDASGAGNDGRVFGAVWVADGRFGGAYRFDITQVDNRIVVPDSESLNPDYVTIAAWVRSDDKDGFWNRIVDKDYRRSYCLSLGGDFNGKGARGKLAFEDNGNYATSDVVVGDGRWHHVAVTFDGQRDRIFVDGIQTKQAQAKKQGPLRKSRWDLCVGNSVVHYSTGEFLGFNGTIDELRIYNRALNATEIQSLMTGPSNNGTTSNKPAAERLEQIKQLFKQGLLSKEDYDKKVKAIIDSL